MVRALVRPFDFLLDLAAEAPVISIPVSARGSVFCLRLVVLLLWIVVLLCSVQYYRRIVPIIVMASCMSAMLYNVEESESDLLDLDALKLRVRRQKSKAFPSAKRSKKDRLGTYAKRSETDRLGTYARRSENEWISSARKRPSTGEMEAYHPKRALQEGQGEAADWKKIKKEKRDLKLIRQRADIGKEDFDIFKDAKHIWENLRVKTIKAADRKALSKTLYDSIKTKLAECVLKHDMSRVVETLMETGDANMREAVLDIFKKTPALAWGKFSSFVAVKAFKHANTGQKKSFCEAFYPYFVKLMTNNRGQTLADKIFESSNTLVHKYACMSSFFGKFYSVYSAAFKTKPYLTALEFTDFYPEFTKTFVEGLDKTLQIMSTKGEFQIRCNYFHMALLEYFTVATPEQQEKLIQDFKIRSEVEEVTNTKFGAMLLLKIFWFNSRPKERKELIRGMGDDIYKMAMDQFGHTVIIGILDSMDDTVFLKKTIIKQCLQHLPELMGDNWGRKVVRFLVDPRNTTDIHPTFLVSLNHGLNNPHSKKDSAVRQNEIREMVQVQLLEAVIENFESWTANNHALLVVTSILLLCKGPKHAEALQLAAKHITKSGNGSRTLKKQLKEILKPMDELAVAEG